MFGLETILSDERQKRISGVYSLLSNRLGGNVGLLDALQQPIGECSYADALAQLGDEEAAAVSRAVEGDEWAPVALANTLADNRVVVSHQAIGRHRRGECNACL